MRGGYRVNLWQPALFIFWEYLGLKVQRNALDVQKHRFSVTSLTEKSTGSSPRTTRLDGNNQIPGRSLLKHSNRVREFIRKEEEMPERLLCPPSRGGKGKGPLLFPLVISGEKWTRLLLSRAIFSQIIPASISPLGWHFEGQWSSKTSSALYDSHGASGDTLTEPVSSTPALSYSFLWTMCRLLPGRTETDSCMFKTYANPSCLKIKIKK